MHIPENDNNPAKNPEENLFDRLSEEKETVNDENEEYTEENTEIDFGLPSPVVSKEEKKRFDKINSLGAKGLTRAVDLGIANFAGWIAKTDEIDDYRADQEDLENFQEVLTEIIPKPKSGSEIKIPLWVQLLLFFAIAFVPIMFTAFSDKRKNEQIIEHKEQIRKLEYEMEVLKFQKEKQELENEILANRTKEEKSLKEENTEN